MDMLLYGTKGITQIASEYHLNLNNPLELKTFIFIVQQNYHFSSMEDKIKKVVFKFKDLKRAEYIQNKT